ncbi:ubiquitin-domain-containing protein [Annulohypoxylon bovei var. microspora]|nr:ubiquitin-domain-containing protein [Annulohypoxylon bovei var. microspora]
MADSAEGSADPQVTFKVKTSGDSQHTITMTETATVSDLKAKLAGEEFENIPIERQRLIYSGRVMKNDEPLSTYKIKNGNTIHLVKSAASNPTPAPASSTSSATPAVPQIPTNMAAGTANNPLAGLTGARYAGLTNLPSADMFGPDGGMVGSMMDEDQLANMLSNPHVAQQMNEMMNNDSFIEMMIQSNPMLRNNPNAREIVRSPLFRHMMTSPEALRGAARLQRALGGRQAAQNAFPMPGVTDNTPNSSSSNGTPGNNSGSNDGGSNPDLLNASLFGNAPIPDISANNNANPFASLFNPFGAATERQGTTGSGTTQATGGAQTESGTTNASQGASTQNPSNPPPNPFASLFGAPGAFSPPATGAGTEAGAGAGAGGAANPFGNMPAVSPEMLQQMVQMLGMGSPSGSPAPTDNRPPEERYAEQLLQLNEMGFYDFDRNVAALRRSGGSVQGAIEHLLSS